jgi:hypothetical protein
MDSVKCGLVVLFLCSIVVAQAGVISAKQTPKSLVRRTFPITKFYDTPDPLPAGKPGELIGRQEFEEYELPAGVLAVQMLYHSRSAAGEDVAASGVVLYPDAKAPPGGWPIIAWAHGLNGTARQCAPSLARNLQHGPFLAMYVNLGYAVVATDYAGLGTTFRNAFSDLQSNAADVIYSIPAARAAVPDLGFRWIAIGSGEGGMAVIGAEELEHEIQDQKYLGGIVISGLNDLQDRFEHADAGTLLSLTYGIKTIFPNFDVKDVLTDKAQALYSRIGKACEPDIGEKLTASEILKSNWENNTFVRQYFTRNRAGQKPAKGALLVIANEADSAAPIEKTVQVISQLCKQGDRIQFERYSGADPGSIIGDSVRDQIGWIEGRFAGRPAPSNCSVLR